MLYFFKRFYVFYLDQFVQNIFPNHIHNSAFLRAQKLHQSAKFYPVLLAGLTVCPEINCYSDNSICTSHRKEDVSRVDTTNSIVDLTLITRYENESFYLISAIRIQQITN